MFGQFLILPVIQYHLLFLLLVVSIFKDGSFHGVTIYCLTDLKDIDGLHIVGFNWFWVYLVINYFKMALNLFHQTWLIILILI